LSLYSTVHWRIASEAYFFERALPELDNIAKPYIPAETEENVRWESLTKSLRGSAKTLREASSLELAWLEAFRLFGLSSLVCALVALTRRPRLAGVLALPFGVLALWMALVVM
jgi:asparagine N-glycosylation enzyme membrane subunit Stt3